MTNTKSTKRALLASVMAMLLCFTMLLGTTFAWFTDSVTSSGNKIVAGTLDVKLLMDADVNGTYDDISDSTSPIFGDGSIAQNNNAETLWEPGKTQVAYLAIQNGGNLDLKYTVGLNVQNVSKDLYEVMEYAIVADADKDAPVTSWTNGKSVVEGTQSVSGDVALKVGETHYFALVIHMNEDAGSEYMGGEVNFDLTVLATQLNSESDAFNTDYDKDATYPEIIAAEDLAAELTPVDGVIAIDKDYVVTGEWTSIDVNGQNITIDGNGHTISNLDKPLIAGDAGGNLTIKNLTIADSNIGTAADENGLGTGAFACFKDFAGNVTFENCHLVNSTVTSEQYRAGGLIGYISGGELTITDCSVVNCEITGVEGAAGLVAYTQVNATITNSKVESTKITATEDRLETKAPLAGAVVGTASGDAVVTLTNVEATNNTVSNNNATAVYSETIGRLAMNATAVVK